jgi:hypothetical protein
MKLRFDKRWAAFALSSACCMLTPMGLFAGPAFGAAPRKALPNWTGVWNPHERNLFDASALTADKVKAKDTGSSLFEASYMRMYPPYRADYETRYEEKLKKTQAGISTDPTAACVPPGVPRIMATPYPLEFIVEPTRVTILFEAFGQTRRIFTDGRKHPNDLDPTYNGHSIGHWEGDTLVVDTVGLRGDTVFDVTGAPHSDAMHVVERIHRSGKTKMEDVITIEDPKALTKPWTVRRTFDLEPKWEIAEYVCEENQRNPVKSDGSTGFVAK